MPQTNGKAGSGFDYARLVGLLRDKTPFRFARYGDGEMKCILGEDVTDFNCDGHQYYPSLSIALRATLRLPQTERMYIGMQSKAMSDMGDKIRLWIRENCPDVEWCDADILHKASMATLLNEFYDVLDDRENVVIIGPAHLCMMANIIKNRLWLVPAVNSWRKREQVADFVENKAEKNAVLLFCAGPMSKVIIGNSKRDDLTMVDVGSAFDVYCGVVSRNYMMQVMHKLAETR